MISLNTALDSAVSAPLVFLFSVDFMSGADPNHSSL